jgi:hypothetical protein
MRMRMRTVECGSLVQGTREANIRGKSFSLSREKRG